MPGPAEIARGNVNLFELLQVNIAAGTVGTTTIVNVTVAVAGVQQGDFAIVNPAQNLWPASQPALNLEPGTAFVGANNIMTVAFQNSTGTAITQTTALPYYVAVFRSGNFSINQTYPAAIT